MFFVEVITDLQFQPLHKLDLWNVIFCNSSKFLVHVQGPGVEIYFKPEGQHHLTVEYVHLVGIFSLMNLVSYNLWDTIQFSKAFKKKQKLAVLCYDGAISFCLRHICFLIGRGRGRGGHPSGLTGKEIGLWYASRGKAKRKETEIREVQQIWYLI